MITIAFNSFREILRSRLIALLIFLSLVLIVITSSLGTLSLGETSRMIQDFGLSFIEISLLIMILIIWSQSLYREMSDRTIYLLLAKPLDRGVIILGKWVGLSYAFSLVLIIEWCILALLLLFVQGSIPHLFFTAILGIWLQSAILSACILIFSVIVSPLIALFATFSVYLFSHSLPLFLDFALSTQNQSLVKLVSLFMGVFPNLSALNYKIFVGTHFLDIGNRTLAFSWGILYLSILLAIAYFVFRSKKYENI